MEKVCYSISTLAPKNLGGIPSSGYIATYRHLTKKRPLLPERTLEVLSIIRSVNILYFFVIRAVQPPPGAIWIWTLRSAGTGASSRL